MRRLGYWLGLIVILSTGAGLPAASQAAHLVMPGETSPESAAPLRPKPTSPSDHPVPVPLPGADPTSAVDTGPERFFVRGAFICRSEPTPIAAVCQRHNQLSQSMRQSPRWTLSSSPIPQ